MASNSQAKKNIDRDRLLIVCTTPETIRAAEALAQENPRVEVKQSLGEAGGYLRALQGRLVKYVIVDLYEDGSAGMTGVSFALRAAKRGVSEIAVINYPKASFPSIWQFRGLSPEGQEVSCPMVSDKSIPCYQEIITTLKWSI